MVKLNMTESFDPWGRKEKRREGPGEISYSSKDVLQEVGGGVTEEERRRDQSQEVLTSLQRVAGAQKGGSKGLKPEGERVNISDLSPELGRVVQRRDIPGGGVVRSGRIHVRTGVLVGRGRLAEVTAPRRSKAVIAWDERKGIGVVIDASVVDPGHVDRLGVNDPSAHYSTTFERTARRSQQNYVEGGAATYSTVGGTLKRARKRTSHWRQVGRNVLARRGLLRLERSRKGRRKKTWEDVPLE